MEENLILYRCTNFYNITLVTNKIEAVHATENENFGGVHWFCFIREPSMLTKLLLWYEKNIWQHFRYVFLLLASIKYVFYVSLQIFMTYGRSVKEKVLSFISYCFFLITTWSLAPKFAHSPITHSPIPGSLIAHSATLTTWSLFPPNHLLPDCLLAPTHPVPSLLLSNLLHDCLIALPLILEK